MTRITAFLLTAAASVAITAQPLAFAGLKASGESPVKDIRSDAQFAKRLTSAQWSWEHKPPFTPHPVAFLADGTIKQSHGWTGKWAITGEREVTVTVGDKHAVIHFNAGITKFHGTSEFDRSRDIWGDIAVDETRSA